MSIAKTDHYLKVTYKGAVGFSGCSVLNSRGQICFIDIDV